MSLRLGGGLELHVAMSLDGFIAGPGHDMWWTGEPSTRPPATSRRRSRVPPASCSPAAAGTRLQAQTRAGLSQGSTAGAGAWSPRRDHRRDRPGGTGRWGAAVRGAAGAPSQAGARPRRYEWDADEHPLSSRPGAPTSEFAGAEAGRADRPRWPRPAEYAQGCAGGQARRRSSFVDDRQVELGEPG